MNATIITLFFTALICAILMGFVVSRNDSGFNVAFTFIFVVCAFALLLISLAAPYGKSTDYEIQKAANAQLLTINYCEIMYVKNGQPYYYTYKSDGKSVPDGFKVVFRETNNSWGFIIQSDIIAIKDSKVES